MNSATSKAFTIVELLIVVVVIAILAAITIVAYNGIQNRARESATQSSASQAGKILATKRVTAGAYPSIAAFETETGLVSSADTTYRYLVSADNADYCVSATNTSKSDISFATSSENASPTRAVCTTNMVINPSFETGWSGWTWNTPGLIGGAAGSSSNPTSGGQVGDRTFRYALSADGSLSNFGPYTQVTGLNSTSEYQLAIWVRSSKAVSYRIHAERRNSSSTNIGTVAGSLVALVPNTWTRLTLSIPVTPNMDRLTFAVYGMGSGLVAGDFVEFDGAMLSADSIPVGYGDGSSSGWTWNAAEHASTSFGPAGL